MSETTALATQLQRNGVESLPDTDRYKVRFKVKSSSSNRLHLISFDSAPGAGYWVCSCRGNIGHGHCRHLKAIGLTGRREGRVSLNASIKAALNG